MRIFGADLRELDGSSGAGTIVALDAQGAVSAVARIEDLPGLAREAARLSAGEPFLLAVDVPVAGGGAGKTRRIDGWVRRRLGVRLPSAKPDGSPFLVGAELITALATAGLPCLPFPDRDRRQSGVAEIHPELVLKALIWEGSAAAAARDLPDREAVLRAMPVPEYRTARIARAEWPERFTALDAALRAVAGAEGFDLRPALDELRQASTDRAVAAAAGLLDAILLAGAARRYLEEPERCAFVGLRETGYVVLPADAFVRRVALRESARAAGHAALFPRASLEARLGPHASLRPSALLEMPGQSQRMEASFEAEAQPRYEFDNLDEMLWWKHCRHVAGTELPTDGLSELAVRLEFVDDDAVGLRLVRSRHKTLSFRFEPPSAWRRRVPPRDGKTYAFRVVRAAFEAP